jgi:hypothetical protein
MQDSWDLASYIKARRGLAGYYAHNHTTYTIPHTPNPSNTLPSDEITTTQSIGCPIVTFFIDKSISDKQK